MVNQTLDESITSIVQPNAAPEFMMVRVESTSSNEHGRVPNRSNEASSWILAQQIPYA